MSEPTDDHKMTCQEAGRIGGTKVKELYGAEHYAEMGKKGGSKTKAHMPADYYQRIGKLGGQKTAASHDSEHFRQMGKKGGAKVRELITLGQEAQRQAAEGE